MKKFFEKRKNPKSKQTEKIEMIKYTFEDFENGIFPSKIQSGKCYEMDIKTRIVTGYEIPDKDFLKIRERQKQYYYQEVEGLFQTMKSSFEKKLLKSGNKLMLQENEIERTKILLHNNPYYKKIIVEGDRTFEYRYSPKAKNRGMKHDVGFIQVDALNKYYKELIHILNLEIASKLIGLVGDYNKMDTKQPVCYYIKDVLAEFNISSNKAKHILLDYSGFLSPKWNKNVVPFIIEYLDKIQKDSVLKNENEKKKPDWIDIGVFFATGQVQELYKKLKNEKGAFVKITEQLGIKKSNRPYISQTIANNPKNKIDDKNLYNSQQKLLKIKAYCEENNIQIVEDFLSQIKS